MALTCLFPLGAAAEEAAHPGFEIGGLMLNGRFDLNLEMREFYGNLFDGTASLVNYHHFLFVSKQAERYFFSADVVDLNFYEFGFNLSERVSLKGGKILVPFGADPPFHHEYGGKNGFDQEFVPFIWAELGGDLLWRVIEGPKTDLSNELYVVNAPNGDEAKVLLPNAVSAPDGFALGDRVKWGYGPYTAYLSFYWNRYTAGRDAFMYGADLSAAYGFLDWGVLRNVALRAGFARMDVEGEPVTMGDYFHFADYLRVDVRLPEHLFLRYLVGSKTIQNYSGLFYDGDNGDAKDTTTHSFALYYRRPDGHTFQAMYQVNLEALEEKNDLFRLGWAYEF